MVSPKHLDSLPCHYRYRVGSYSLNVKMPDLEFRYDIRHLVAKKRLKVLRVRWRVKVVSVQVVEALDGIGERHRRLIDLIEVPLHKRVQLRPED